MNSPAQRISNREIFTFMIGTIIATIFASVPVVIVGEHLSEELGIEADVLMTSHPTLILLSLCTIQLAFCAVLANYLYHSKESIKDSLSLQKVTISPTLWILLMLGSIGVSTLPRLFIHESEYMDSFAAMIEAQPISFGLILIVAGSVIPGVVEELLCRGYLQRRLLDKWHPAIAIYVSSMFFSALHMDPTHALALLPFGLWLGFLHWHFKSILPSIVCHIANNAFAFSILVFSTKVMEISDTTFDVIMGFFMLCLVLCMARLYTERSLFKSKSKPQKPTAAHLSEG